ncbi:MAG: hypothetical protein ACLSFZ_06900 [Frisingicoccus sp.]
MIPGGASRLLAFDENDIVYDAEAQKRTGKRFCCGGAVCRSAIM